MLILQLLGLVMSGPAAPILKNYLGIGSTATHAPRRQ